MAKSAPKNHRSLVIYVFATHNFNIASVSKSRACYREYRSSTRQQMTCVTRGDNFNYTIRQIQLPSNHFRLFHYISKAICPPGHLNLNLYPSHARSLWNSSLQCLCITRRLRIVIKFGFCIDINGINSAASIRHWFILFDIIIWHQSKRANKHSCAIQMTLFQFVPNSIGKSSIVC